MQEIKNQLKQAIYELYDLDFDPELTPSPENIPADYSANAPLKLAKDLHQPPMQIAEELSKAWAGDGPGGGPLLSASEVGEEKVRQDPPERVLMKKLLEYKTVLAESVTEMAPHKVANFLYELAQAFSRFYENCPVVGSSNESERTKLVQVYLNTMTHGLNILGIEIPEEM